MTLSDFASRLTKVKYKTIAGFPGFEAACPAHDDRKPSLGVWETPDGYIHVKCISAGCSEGAILGAIGLTQADRRVHLNGSVKTDTREVVYPYTDAFGTYLFEKCRFYKNGEKEFRQRIRQPDGSYLYKLADLGDKAKTLYNLPEVIAALDSGETIYVNEGEKACEAFRSRGLVATCQPGGAGDRKWLPQHTSVLEGANVVIVQDQDQAGRKYAADVLKALLPVAASVQIVESRLKADKADAFDHFAAGFSPEDFDEPSGEPLPEPLPEPERAEVNEEGKQFPLTDSGNAERLVALFGNYLRYVPSWNKWLFWDGWKWCSDETASSKVYQVALKTARQMQQDAIGVSKDLAKWGMACESKARIESMIALASKSRMIVVTADDLDSHPNLLNLKNGVIDLQTGELLAHNRNWLLTKGIDTPYDPEAKCPTWHNFLRRAMGGSTELVSYLWKAVGYSLSGDTSEKAFFFLYGPTDTGKSTFVETLLAMIGDYAQQTSTETLMVKKGDGGINNAVAALRGARFVAAPETQEGRRLDEQLVKSLTGRDTIRARFLYQEEFDFKPQLKLWITGNHQPTIRGTDDAIWRRVVQIPFEVSIPAAEQDQELPNQLEAELPGILAWAVAGYRQWKTNRLGRPQWLVDAVEKYRSSQDVIGAFLEEKTERSPAYEIRAGELYSAYKDWCKETGEFCQSMTRFGKAMQERGEASVDVNGRKYCQGRRILEP